MISTTQASKMLQKGCRGFLARVKEVMENKSGPESVFMIREFSNVFPEELTSLPYKRKIDFEIDLVPSTRPMSIPPYRMAPAELKELKE